MRHRGHSGDRYRGRRAADARRSRAICMTVAAGLSWHRGRKAPGLRRQLNINLNRKEAQWPSTSARSTGQEGT